ncbi:MAG: HEAT repeat domain-containing protein, partial [Acidobacteriaceae bacterium]|nr:HEAT repeat domain-containing protein [Acidobacteriaceae bacterium]
MPTLLLFLAAPMAPAVEQSDVDHAWTVLRDGVDDKNADHRAKAVHALGSITHNQRAEEWAEKSLSDSSPDVRLEAAAALGQMGAVGARPKLRDILNDADVKVVVAAANSLYLLKDPAAYDVY